MVSKRRDMPYLSGRGGWLKSKCVLQGEFRVLGFLPSTTFKNAIGALVLGQEEGGKLVYAGRVGTGFSEGWPSNCTTS